MTARSIIMIRPMNFGYNAETATSNHFQHRPVADSGIEAKALKEFEQLAQKISDAGVEVKIFNDTALPPKPDAVFPNNWFSTHADGTLVLYPMQSVLRRNERRADIIEWLQQHYRITRLVDLTNLETQSKFLEGTGSLVFDHGHKMVYACTSPRTDEDLVKLVADELKYTYLCFKAVDTGGREVYHTNVVMNVAEHLAVVCFDAITQGKEKLQAGLLKSARDILQLSMAQLENFAGNMLMLQNGEGDKFMIMSSRALQSLNYEQVKLIEKHAAIISADLSTIETVGGGSARCMIAEVFAEKRTA